MEDAQVRLAQAWDEAAEGYEGYFVPRFAPWVADAVAPVRGELPRGPILVPCCGTFPELPALRAARPERELVGVDLSAGMVDIARARAAGDPRVRVVVGDAVEVEPSGYAAVVSVFGLQQLPDPAAALAFWVRGLRSGGVLSAVFWPPQLDADGPFALLGQAAGGGHPAEPPARPDRLADAVVAAGGVVERDEDVVHPVSHPDAATFFAAMTTGGPGRAAARTMPPGDLEALRTRFLEQAPGGEWTHTPRARHVVARLPG
ncbi:MAG: class I SAM-dependent methyltransferase [Thermocrispum sp.]